MSEEKKNCLFHSVWEEGEIVTPAVVDLATGEVFPEVSDEGEEFETLIEQYIDLDGRRILIDPDRWEDDGELYVSGASMAANDRGGHSMSNFKVVIEIEASDGTLAEEVRSEIAAALEDARDSDMLPSGVRTFVGDIIRNHEYVVSGLSSAEAEIYRRNEVSVASRARELLHVALMQDQQINEMEERPPTGDDYNALYDSLISKLQPVVNIATDERLSRAEAVVRSQAVKLFSEEGVLELDEDAAVSFSPDGGAYVQMWQYVDTPEIRCVNPNYDGKQGEDPGREPTV